MVTKYDLDTDNGYFKDDSKQRAGYHTWLSLILSAHFAVWVTVWVGRLTHILTHTFSSGFATKSPEILRFRGFFGAAGQIRTADLILTNYSWPCYSLLYFVIA